MSRRTWGTVGGGIGVSVRLNCEKRRPLTTEPDPAGNPSPPDHWDLVPELVVQAPPLFGGRRGPFEMAPFEHPNVLWQQDGVWRIDPYSTGPNAGYDRDFDLSTYRVIDGPLLDTLAPEREYLLQHWDLPDRGECGVELVPRTA